MRTVLRSLCVLLAAAALHAAPAHAQTVELVGRGDVDWDVRLRDLIRSGTLNVLPNDTLIATGDTVRGPVLAAGITVRLQGVIAGDLIGVDANLFLRPGGRVTGNVINVAGGYYPSEMATVDGTVTSDPTAPYDVEHTSGGFRIIGTEDRSLLDLDGIFGFHPPRYDRVDGLTLAWGARYLLPRLGLVEPFVAGKVGFHFEREKVAGGAEIGVRRRRTELAVGGERWTYTNDAWIRDDLLNAWSMFAGGRDYRNYYEGDRFYAEARRELERGERSSEATLRVQLEDARSLAARDVYTLFDPDSIRFNPLVNEGRIASAIATFATEWNRPNSELEAEVGIEAAGEVAGGDFSFASFRVYGDYAMRAFANHTLEIETYFQGPLPGTDSLPRQRWSFVGGSSTLYTFELGEFPGDRVAYVESEYYIPFSNRIRLPLVGTPTFSVFHHIGMGWSDQVSRDLEQNVGAKLTLFFLYLRVVVDPSDTDKTEWGIGLKSPKRWPWQQ